MAKNKDNLLKLLEFLDKSILNEPENLWFVEELRKRIKTEVKCSSFNSTWEITGKLFKFMKKELPMINYISVYSDTNKESGKSHLRARVVLYEKNEAGLDGFITFRVDPSIKSIKEGDRLDPASFRWYNITNGEATIKVCRGKAIEASDKSLPSTDIPLMLTETPKSNDRFDDIYELCVERILHQQAENFYKDFSIVSLKPQLIEDFKKMEMWRRRNNLHEFCLAMYQQIECVVNHISTDNRLNDVASTLMGHSAYVDYNNPIVSNRMGSYQIANLLFSSDIVEKSDRLVAAQYANDKFRCIYYFVCYNGMLKNNQFENFVEETNIFKDIYGIRNQNHRGNTPDEYEKDRECRIYPYPTVHFFKYLNFLANFMHRINHGFPLSDELVRFSKSVSRIVVRPKIEEPKILGKIELPDTSQKRTK